MYVANTLDALLPRGARIWGRRRYYLSGQQERHTIGTEWACIKYAMNTTPEHTIFFVSDRIKKNEVHVQYCPSHNMLADYFTKPLQGATFRKFRDAIMNCNFARSDEHPSDHRSVLDHKRANEQSHAHVPRLTQNHEQKQTESDNMKDRIQPQEKKNPRHPSQF